jgi:hypothetical protein
VRQTFWMKLVGNQRGKAESKAPAIITIIILSLLIFMGIKLIPIKLKNMKFVQDIQKILNIDYSREYKDFARGGFNEYTMREKVMESAKKLNIPIKDFEKQIDVQWPENKIFTVKVDYVERINFPIYGPYDWKFHLYLEQDPHAGKTVEAK